MIGIRRDIPAKDIFRYMGKLDFPAQYRPDFCQWEASFSHDTDGAGRTVGGCEVHFLEDRHTAYLRWIFIEDRLCGQGLGTVCMDALKADLYGRGVRCFDTDTAVTNAAAQHFYEKTGFVRRGVTRSYMRIGQEGRACV